MSVTSNRAAYLTEQGDAADEELGNLLDGLRQRLKTISPKYFYDERGSQLFEQITELPEYYLTRTELAIMHRHVEEMAQLIGPEASLIEFGSGSSQKIRILLDHIDALAAYVPVDISKDHLVASADAIAADYPAIEVLPVAADFTQPFALPDPVVTPIRNIVYFPGSTIGNFSPEAALDLLKVMHHEAGAGGRLLIGIDLRKDRNILERAYNDASGVTAAFNLNILSHLNNTFGADFDPAAYRHVAEYNDSAGRIEMYLVSEKGQTVTIGRETIAVADGERILTEHSHKYTLEGFDELAAHAGFRPIRHWTDADEMFAICFLERD
ncbi:MAG: L-histidine N(alpha)-methyltransferase [Woeseiaceae bacterium]|nr:L-histidine N(alpha)-methyltransferase [Woeseiaceae bacterium]